MKPVSQAKMGASSLALAALLLSWEVVNGQFVAQVQPQTATPLDGVSVVEGRLVIPALIRPVVLDRGCVAPPPTGVPATFPAAACPDDDDPSLKSLLYYLLFANAKNRGAPSPPGFGPSCPCGCGRRGYTPPEYPQGYSHYGCGCPYDRSPRGRNGGGSERPKAGKRASKPAKAKPCPASGSYEDDSQEDCDRNGISLCISTDC